MADQPIALDFAHHEIDDFIVYYPVLLFVDVVPVVHLLGHLLVHLREIDHKVEEDREVFVLQRIDSFSDAILISHKVSFLEVYLLLYDCLK